MHTATTCHACAASPEHNTPTHKHTQYASKYTPLPFNNLGWEHKNSYCRPKCPAAAAESAAVAKLATTAAPAAPGPAESAAVAQVLATAAPAASAAAASTVAA